MAEIMTEGEASLLFLGTGTSHGIPELTCKCNTCKSTDPRDKRNRCCALLKCPDGTNILFDCGPEIRIQMTHCKVKKVDYTLITHAHADHINGLDDLRVFGKERPLPIYMDVRARKEILERFDYAFPETSRKKNCVFRFEAHTVEDKPFNLGPYTVTPIPLYHGKLQTTGYRIGNFAYLTDVNVIPDESYELLEGVEIVVIDALNYYGHPTHNDIASAFKQVMKIKPKRAYFIHQDDYDTAEGNDNMLSSIREEHPEIGDTEVEFSWDYREISGIRLL